MTFIVTYSLNGFTKKMRVKNATSESDAQRKFTLWIHSKFTCSEIRILEVTKEGDVFENFKNKIEEISGVKCNEITLVTWGNGDKKMLNRNCNLNKTTSPFTRYLNIDKWFARFYGLEQSCTLRKALEMIGLEFVGEQHRALNDALNTSIILEKMGVNLLPENNFKKISARQIQK